MIFPNYNFGARELVQKKYPDDFINSFDSLNVRFLGDWAFGPSWTICCDSLRHLAFLATGGRVCILDVSNPTNIRLLSDTISTRGFIEDIHYDHISHKLFITSGPGGFEIWDVGDPVHPVKLGAYNLPKIVCGFDVEGARAYLACGREGLRIIDISNPSNPYEIGFCLTPDSALDVVVSGSYAYVGDGEQYYNGGGLVVIDISTPANPQIIGYCGTPNFAEDLEILGSYVYVADGEPGVGKLRIIDVSTPSNPYEIGFFRPDTTSWYTICIRVYVRDTIGFIAYYNTGIFIVNLADPTNVRRIARYDTPGQAVELFAYDSCVYVADNADGLCIINISDLSNPIQIGNYDGFYEPNNLFISDTLIFVSHRDEGVVRILDVSDPSRPKLLSEIFTTYGTDGIYVSNSYAYITDWNGLCIVDISNPQHPQMVGFCDMNGYPSNVFVADTFAYVASFFSGLYVINIARPSAPFIVGYCAAPWLANAVIVIGGYAYVGNYDDGFYVINVSNPANPYLVGQCNTVSAQIAINDTFAYTAGLGTGLHIINISNPYNPQEIASVPGNSVIDVLNLGNYTYIAEDRFGFRIFNTSNPYVPQEVGFYALPNLIPGYVCATDNLIFVSTSAGLQIFEYFGTDVKESDKKRELGSIFGIRILQNPVCGNTLSISLPLGINAEIGLSIYNCIGQRVFNDVIFSDGNRTHLDICVSNLASGVYFLCISTKSNTKILKFVVIH